MRRMKMTREALILRNCNPAKTLARFSFSKMHEIKKLRPINVCVMRPRTPILSSIVIISSTRVYLNKIIRILGIRAMERTLRN